MIQGISGALSPNNMVPGGFYLRRDGQGQLIVTMPFPTVGGEDDKLDYLELGFGASKILRLSELQILSSVALLRNVAVRVEPTSLIGAVRDVGQISEGQLLVAEDGAAWVVARWHPGSNSPFQFVSLNSGQFSVEVPKKALIFSGWSLVRDESGVVTIIHDHTA